MARMPNMLVSYALEKNVAVLTMDDGKANALSETMIVQLLDGIARAEREAQAIVLTGRPDKFCAGFDMKVMMSGIENAIALLTRGADLLLKLYAAPLPVVVACTGHALAGGALVLLTGDARVCTAGAYRIGLNEVSIGLPVPVLAMELARDRLAKSELSRATLFARIYDPEAAARAGFVDEVVSPAELRARAFEEAARLAELSRFAFAETKKRLRARTIQYIRDTLEADMKSMMPASS
jgi:enoyl-CoA hydratase